MRLGKRLRTARDETGQVFVFTVLCMVVLIGLVGFAVDVGHAYLVQRQLQSGVDAAALAGAQELPDPNAVITTATNYSASPADKNALTANSNATTNVTVRCLAGVPGCSSTFGTYNAVRVDGSSTVPTYFAKVLGINSLTVHATATACSPCAAKPLDIMIVLDRTGSMCDVSSNGVCRDENNAITGIKTFLGFMDPSLDEVGLAVFPPAQNASAYCATPTSGGQNYGYNAYWPSWIPSTKIPPQTPSLYAIASPTFDYLVQNGNGWQLNPASDLIQKLNNCVKPAGTTSYVDAIDEAQHELDVHGRGNVQDVVIILTDGAANVSPKYVPSYIPSSHFTKPCTMGIDAANHLKAQGTIVYTIGYDVDDDSNGGQCGAEGFTASWALQQMATVDPADGKPNYYDQPIPAQLNTIFTKIAADISRPSSRLIDNNTK